MTLRRLRDVVKSDNAELSTGRYAMLIQRLNRAKRYHIIKTKGRGWSLRQL
jgi:hypothetical protein